MDHWKPGNGIKTGPLDIFMAVQNCGRSRFWESVIREYYKPDELREKEDLERRKKLAEDTAEKL